MENVFMSHVKKHSLFSWGRMGDIQEGRPTLGDEMPVAVYRLQQQAFMSTLVRNVGVVKADHFFIEAGRLAGSEFAMHKMVLEETPEVFIQHLKEVLFDLKIGVLNLEHFDIGTGNMAVTISNDLDCSGIANADRPICKFDEGFLAGILGAYTGECYHFEEIDCWSTGANTCRFVGTVIK